MSWKRKGVLSKVFPARTNIQQRAVVCERWIRYSCINSRIDKCGLCMKIGIETL